MKVIIIGLGTQGNKRKKYLGKDFVASVDPFKKQAKYKDIKDVPLKDYDTALICVPEEKKINLIKFCIKNKKNILVEKPLISKKVDEIRKIERLAVKNKIFIYTAYNHRFEPHFVKIKNLISSKKLGKIYSCRIFYGNGTARLSKLSNWRDRGLGVVTDIGSHLLDTCLFWFGNNIKDFKIVSSNKFENKSLDHAVLLSKKNLPRIELEMTLCMWKNHFTCDILGSKGSAHVSSLCKWGPSIFTFRKRVLPSGKPKENKITLIKKDPTWNFEYKFFKKKVNSKTRTSLKRDVWIQKQFNKIF
tara:strand:+ start:134 stop:1039 length:906 start_codon:yes stop_codon:yes gene_type:complete